MKILKHVGAILLATVSVVIILDLIDSALDNDMKPLDGTSLLVFIIFGVLPMAGAIALLRNIAINRPPSSMPELWQLRKHTSRSSDASFQSLDIVEPRLDSVTALGTKSQEASSLHPLRIALFH
jgi:hypothetical protein